MAITDAKRATSACMTTALLASSYGWFMERSVS